MKLEKIIGAALAVFALVSCGKEDTTKDDGVEAGKGLINFSIAIPGSSAVYSATKQGPYAPEETVIVQLPSSEENPLDVTELECHATFDNDCYADPAVPAVMDFTEPYKITVVNRKGEKQVNYIAVELVYPNVKVEKVWVTDARQMNMEFTHDMSIAADDEYVYVLDAVQSMGDKIHVLNRATGAFVKDIILPTICIAQVYVDDSGTLLCSRYNEYGAGFRLYAYDPAQDNWSNPIIDYVDSETVTVPYALGIRATLIGNVKEGNAYVYATSMNAIEYYCWKITDGVAGAPSIVRYGGAKENWYYAVVRRDGVESGSDIYVAGNNYVAYPNESDSYTYFHKQNSTGDILAMNAENLGWRVMNFKTFSLGGSKWLATYTQWGPNRYSWCQFDVFNITDEANWSMKPGDARYQIDFHVYVGEANVATNYNMNCGMDVRVEGNTAYLFVSNPCRNAPEADDDKGYSTVTCYKMIMKDN